MEQLPYIDEHVISVPVDRAETWSALLRWACRDPGDPSTLRLPFFWLDDVRPPARLGMSGQHPFSHYRLEFELTELEPHRTRLTARTWAEFPGLAGMVYRALVIGTGGHRVAVRLMLKRIADQTVSRVAS
jgi:hypothetical protein